MAQVKVWNKNIHPLTELFKGNQITIPAGKYIEMEFFEAHEFKGQYHAQPVDVDGRLLDDPKHYKMITIEKAGGAEAVVLTDHMCLVCKHKSPSEEELDAHVKVRHADQAKLELPAEDEKKKQTKKAG